MNESMGKVKWKIKWKNILGLVVLIAAIFLIVAGVSFISKALGGDCVEKGSIKACFSSSKSVEGWAEITTVTTKITNTGKVLSDASVSMRISPYLTNLSATRRATSEKLAPGDTIEWEFKLAPTGDAKGEFKIEFDINNDGVSDKDMMLKVS